MYEVLDFKAFQALDKYERYDSLRPNDSLYVRRAVRLIEPAVDAWVYFYNKGIDGKPLVSSGDWAEHKAARMDASTQS